MSIVGTKTPEWSGVAYLKGEEQALSSKDFQGKWHVIYWYPLDFTFVCPTEIRGFQTELDNFKDDGVEVIGCSTDSFYSHNAWFADRSIFADEITHPVLADTSHGISRAFGVLKEDLGAAFHALAIGSYAQWELTPQAHATLIHDLQTLGLNKKDPGDKTHE